MAAALPPPARRRLATKQAPFPAFAPPLVRTRLVCKQRPPPAWVTPVADELSHAMAAEQCAADGLVALSPDARRTHVHYTHVRTDNPTDVQPSALTRE